MFNDDSLLLKHPSSWICTTSLRSYLTVKKVIATSPPRSSRKSSRIWKHDCVTWSADMKPAAMGLMATFDEDGHDYQHPSKVMAGNYGKFNSELSQRRTEAWEGKRYYVDLQRWWWSCSTLAPQPPWITVGVGNDGQVRSYPFHMCQADQ